MRGILALTFVCLIASLAAGLVAFGTADAGSSDVTHPNDPAWSFEWGPGVTRASDLWQLTTGSPSVVIGVVDTGLGPVSDLTHVLPGWNIVGNDNQTADDFGHGTWVSSVIGATGDNGMGMAGYCWQCSILPVRVAAGRTGALAPAVAAGIRWAVDHGARIINVSLASNSYDFSELGAVEYAKDHGVLLVGSAGNEGDGNQTYPGGYPGVLAVAGSDQSDALYSWASRGPWVALAAPGCDEVLDPWAGPAYACGSSFAPPVVSGIAGLLMSLNPSLTANQVSDALRATAHPVTGIGGGRVDAWAAAHYLGLAPAVPPVPAPPAPPPTPREVFVTTGIVRRSTHIRLDLRAGAVALQLSGPAAINCSMSFRAAGGLHVDLPGERNVRSLATTVAKGSYPITIGCKTANAKAYEFTATGRFLN
jgi:hypothetical protein